MKKLKLVLLALLAVILFANGAFCADGDELTTNNFRVDSNGQVTMRNAVQLVTTSDTLTNAESGKTFVVNASSGYVELTLPTAVAGLNYTVTAIGGNVTKGQYSGRIYIDVPSTDTLYGCVTSDSASTVAAGESIYSSSSTGDSVTLVSPAATYWVCTDTTNEWVDGGTAP